MTKHELILDFIKQFRQFGPDVEACFTSGMCWHFASILHSRFGHDSEIMYDPVINHFATRIDDRIYDITGDITDDPDYAWDRWSSYMYRDSKHTERIRRDCIWKLPREAVVCGFCSKCFTDDWGSTICGRTNQPVDTDETCEYGISKFEEV